MADKKITTIFVAMALSLCCAEQVCAQISPKTLVSMAIPNAGLEEIRGEVYELTKTVNSDIVALQLMAEAYPLLQDSVGLMVGRAANNGITIDVSLGTTPPLPEGGFSVTTLDEEKYASLGKVKKMAYLVKVHKALRNEHAGYAPMIEQADRKAIEIFGFLDETERQVRAAELKRGGAGAVSGGLDAAARETIRRFRENVAGRNAGRIVAE